MGGGRLIVYQHLLVPLDGSGPAEAALTVARALVERVHMPVTLLHVVEADAPRQTHAGRHLRGKAEAEAYLADAARRFFAPGADIRCHVHAAASRDVAAEIAGHPFELAADLVVMSPHGRRGFRGVRLGNMAQQVLSLGHEPVLMARTPGAAPAAPWRPNVILFPHDGDPVHESVLPMAEAWTRLFEAALKLVMVVPAAGTLGGLAAAGRIAGAAGHGGAVGGP
jgi:nucleotide-binding universal stress UspA family protein